MVDQSAELAFYLVSVAFWSVLEELSPASLSLQIRIRQPEMRSRVRSEAVSQNPLSLPSTGVDQLRRTRELKSVMKIRPVLDERKAGQCAGANLYLPPLQIQTSVLNSRLNANSKAAADRQRSDAYASG